MSTDSKFAQTAIPGPIEVTDEVLFANAHPSMSHMSPDFARVFGDCIRMTRQLLYSEDAQPFLIAGSGTLGWDQVSANLVEPGENALVLHSGYFADSFADCLQTYGANVDQIKAEIGGAVKEADIESALQAKKYKVVTVTHVDTSTAIANVVKRVSPDTLVVVDAVCSVASEEIQMDAWGIDVVLTASQKGLGTPPGLSIVVASQKAVSYSYKLLKVFENRSTPVTTYYGSWKKWLPVMKAYENNSAAYFATPPVNLIYAFHASLTQIMQGSVSLEQRFKLHKEVSRRVKKAAEEIGFKGVPLSEDVQANGMSALYFPDGFTASDIVPRLLKKDVVVAGGLHASIKGQHMGVSVVDPSRGDIDKVISAVKESLAEAKVSKQ
ncbi:pyridoxal phosphate-dependent transferase [Suillus fuscotomentosus]|uniref:alanine--glyoxylate transaminase n=1 Tax=Suillus fuscotomentosus TaxID=1912939 RepID=A0AAD4EKD6_9AGAM|nr:pyridoxal phosphate-dependent transferase [Suillus fuscotomentosus]KAG1907727.1 pyridoxal phosphate-dependent transferase [Suillus fuscotomentosus]